MKSAQTVFKIPQLFHFVAAMNLNMQQIGNMTVKIEHVQPSTCMSIRRTVPVPGSSRLAILQPASIGAVVIIQKRGIAIHKLKMTRRLFHFLYFKRLEALPGINVDSGNDLVTVTDHFRNGNFIGTAEIFPGAYF